MIPERIIFVCRGITLHRTTQNRQNIEQHNKSAGSATSLRVLPWHLPLQLRKKKHGKTLSQAKKKQQNTLKNLQITSSPDSLCSFFSRGNDSCLQNQIPVAFIVLPWVVMFRNDSRQSITVFFSSLEQPGLSSVAFVWDISP